MKNITKLLHEDRKRGGVNGEMHAPVSRNISFHYDSSSAIGAVFQGDKFGYTYGRQNNPTATALEKKINIVERGFATAVFSTGMAAIGSVLFSLLGEGDGVVVSKYLFGNTKSLFESFERFGVDVRYFDSTRAENLDGAIDKSTRLVFVETIANPRTQVADLDGIGRICKDRNIVYVVDNTMTSPALFEPSVVNASLVINSLSKYIAGHAACLGGSVTDTGVFDWTCFPNINDRYKKYETNTWGIVQIRKKGIRDFGATLSPDSANLIMLGMETLFLRMEKISENAMKLATFLSSLKEVKAVYYPGLSNHPQHNIAKRLFKRFSGLMSFELHSWVDMAEFLDGLDVFACSSNLGDNRSLMIPVAQTIFYEVGVDERVKMEISESLIRLSVGIEDIDDLCEDILSSIKKLDYI